MARNLSGGTRGRKATGTGLFTCPFKHGLECDGLIFVGGQVSMDADANVLDPNDMSAQTVP